MTSTGIGAAMPMPRNRDQAAVRTDAGTIGRSSDVASPSATVRGCLEAEGSLVRP
jgi:hypothetical protein